MTSLSFHATRDQGAPLEVSRSYLSTIIYLPLLSSVLVTKSANQPESTHPSFPELDKALFSVEGRAQALVHVGQMFSHWATSGVPRQN